MEGPSSFWLQQGTRMPELPPPPPSSSGPAAVAVLGAGLAGAATAFFLRREGLAGRLVLVDPRGAGRGATARNAGHVWPLSNEPFDEAGLALLRALCAELGVASLRGTGGVEIVRADHELALYPPALKQGSAQVWDAARLYAQMPALAPDAFFAAIHEAQAAAIDPVELVAALLRATPDLELVQQAAEAVNLDTGTVTLADGSSLEADHVVFAVNALTHKLLPQSVAPIEAVRGQCMYIQINDPDFDIPRFQYSIDDSFEYGTPWGERGLIVGGARLDVEERNIEDDSVLCPEMSRRLRNRLKDTFGLYPHQYEVTHEWTGLMGFTPDEAPLIGLLPEAPAHGILAGFSGNGLLVGFHGARTLAQLLMGKEPTMPIPEKWRVGRTMIPLEYDDTSYHDGYTEDCEDWDEDEEDEDEDEDRDDSQAADDDNGKGKEEQIVVAEL